jgi:RNA polymerase sigma factor (TIGR02999 family)
MPPTTPKCVSELLAKWQDGDQEALRSLVPFVYDELRRLAHHHLRGERSNQSLQSAALVHEAYLRLANQSPRRLENRAHFFAVASLVMRQILVDNARKRRAAKRGPDCKLRIEEGLAIAKARDVDLVALDDALSALARLDEQQSRIVELRFFCGLSIEETSEVLGVSPATIKRDWATARAWLYREMNKTLSE